MILRFFIYNMVLLYALFDEKILFDIFKSEQEKKYYYWARYYGKPVIINLLIS